MAESDFTPAFLALRKRTEVIAEEHGFQTAQVFFYEGLVELGKRERLKNLYHCKDKDTKKKVWFRPHEEQLSYIEKQTFRDLILKARQIGFTQLSIVDGVDNDIFVPGSTEGLMAHKKEKAVAELFQRVRDTFDWFIETWGTLIPLALDKDSANKLILNAAGIEAIEVEGKKVFQPRVLKTSYEVSHDFRSSSLTRLHISEASRVDLARAQGSIDSVPQNGRVIMESTACGRDPTFYSKYKQTREAKRRKDIYVWESHFFPWFQHYPEPGHTLKMPERFVLSEKERSLKALGATDISLVWRRWKIAENFEGDEEKFDEEYPSDDESCFLGGKSIVPRKYLNLMEKWVREPVKKGFLFPKDRWLEFKEDSQGFVHIWEMPKVGEQYVIGADPSEGVGGDASAVYVKRRSNGEYVARIWGQLFPEELSENLYLLALLYNRAYICFELNNHGWVVKDRLVGKQYSNLYHRITTNEIAETWEHTVGFKTDRNSKERIAMNWVARLREGKIKTFDDDLLTQMTNFQRDEHGRIRGVEGSHDDLCMAALLTEEMDHALGPYEPALDESHGEVEVDPVTGYPL